MTAPGHFPGAIGETRWGSLARVEGRATVARPGADRDVGVREVAPEE
ncbi:hypothetical protein JOE64_002535 [Microbacterium dextranolyticum]|nr:hypothetical protein [Microbacterium dextranolyticum]